MVLHTPPSQLMMQTDAPFLPASTCELLPFSYEKKINLYVSVVDRDFDIVRVGN